MLKKVIKTITVLLIVLTVALTAEPERLLAASADIILAAEEESIRLGDTVTVSLKIEAEVLPGDFTAYLLYPSEMLTFISGPEIVSGGEGVLKIDDHVTSSERSDRKYILKFKTTDIGACTFSLRESPELYEFEEGYLMSVSSNELKITVMPSKDVSDDNTLAVLKVSPGSLSPSFSADTDLYSVKVPSYTERLIVSAAANDRAADLSVRGNENLAEGNNTVEIEVTAPNGEKKIYTIICEKEASEDTGKDNEEKDPEKNVKDENPEATGTEPGENGDSGEKTSENDGKNYVITEEEPKVITDSIEALELSASYEKSLSVLTLIIAGLSMLCMVLLILVIRLALRKKDDDREQD